MSGSRGKERGSRGKQRREKTGKGNGEREAQGGKARGDVITCLWGPDVDREEAFIRSTAKTISGVLAGHVRNDSVAASASLVK